MGSANEDLLRSHFLSVVDTGRVSDLHSVQVLFVCLFFFFGILPFKEKGNVVCIVRAIFF